MSFSERPNIVENRRGFLKKLGTVAGALVFGDQAEKLNAFQHIESFSQNASAKTQNLGQDTISRRDLFKHFVLGMQKNSVAKNHAPMESGLPDKESEDDTFREALHKEQQMQLQSAETPVLPSFERTWNRTDKPVADLLVSRTWMWGPAIKHIEEEYAQAPGGKRTVQYFDKSRMEDNSFRTTDPPWDVTNGLLAKELVTGIVQLGDDIRTHFEQRESAQVNIAGDPDDSSGPTYASFKNALVLAPHAEGSVIRSTINRSGTTSEDERYDQFGITVSNLVLETNHRVASVFWDFMNSSGPVHENDQTVHAPLFQSPYYATGLPITEAYWATVLVGGQPTEVLTQVFERRVLTYNPRNPDGWKVEAGNVGIHYSQWRYDQDPDNEPPFPREIMSEDGSFILRNHRNDAGYKEGKTTPDLTFEKMVQVLHMLFPNEKFECGIEYLENVPVNGSINYNQEKDFYGWRIRFLYEWDQETMTNKYILGFEERDFSTLTPEQIDAINDEIIGLVFIFAEKKGDIFKGVREETSEQGGRFSHPEQGEPPLVFAYTAS